MLTKGNVITIEWPYWRLIVNEGFIPLVENRDRYLILYGGRGSGKSDFAAKKLIYRCLKEEYFRCILIRQSYNSIKDSSYDQIKCTLEDMGIADHFEFKLQPLEIICKLNGNKFIARGCDDTTKLKSLKDFSAVWWEEDIPTEEDFITVTTSIRTTRADYLQEIFTVNPEVEGNYQDHWFWKRFFSHRSAEKSFSDVKTVKIGQEQTATLTYTVHHSTYRDNRWIPNGFIAYLQELKRTNPYYYEIYCEGNFGNKQMGGLAYKKFVRGTHTDKVKYDPELPLHISFDFNVKPYMTLTVWQIVDGKRIHCVDSIATTSPENTTRGVCREFSRRYQSHKSGLFVYGDPSGKNDDTKMEQGFNNYSIIEQELQQFRPALRVASKHPPVAMRLNFINSIFDSNFNGLSILISDSASELINDLMFQKESSDGGKMKEKVTRNGDTFEKYGHMSDSMDYFICEAFSDDFIEYQEGPSTFTKTTSDESHNHNPRWEW